MGPVSVFSKSSSLCSTWPCAYKQCPPLNGRQPLHYAAMRGWWEVTKILLEHGARVDAEGPLGSQPLHYAAQYGKREVAELLLDHEADLDAKDSIVRLRYMLCYS